MSTPKPGDLVVVVRTHPRTVNSANHYLHGEVGVLGQPLSPFPGEFPYLLRVKDPDRPRRGYAEEPVHEVRLATPEEQAAYWLEHGGAP